MVPAPPLRCRDVMSAVQGMFARGELPVLEKAMAFQERRQALIASNIANASTPFYRPQDLDEGEFNRLLREAVKARDEGSRHRFELGPSKSFGLDEADRLTVSPIEAREGQVRHDGNAFNVERQMARLADNTLSYQRNAQLLEGSYRMLSMAIRGRSS